ncbi:translation initiation factor IF-2 [Thermaerobacter sp. FW80]|nr:translation initiation factor IF-2 [Thermaerobacter sp. FW80]
MSRSIRIYELARKLGVQSKEILRILHDELNIDIQNHMSTINDQVARRITQILRGDSGPAGQSGGSGPTGGAASRSAGGAGGRDGARGGADVAGARTAPSGGGREPGRAGASGGPGAAATGRPAAGGSAAAGARAGQGPKAGAAGAESPRAAAPTNGAPGRSAAADRPGGSAARPAMGAGDGARRGPAGGPATAANGAGTGKQAGRTGEAGAAPRPAPGAAGARPGGAPAPQGPQAPGAAGGARPGAPAPGAPGRSAPAGAGARGGQGAPAPAGRGGPAAAGGGGAGASGTPRREERRGDRAAPRPGRPGDGRPAGGGRPDSRGAGQPQGQGRPAGQGQGRPGGAGGPRPAGGAGARPGAGRAGAGPRPGAGRPGGPRPGGGRPGGGFAPPRPAGRPGMAGRPGAGRPGGGPARRGGKRKEKEYVRDERDFLDEDDEGKLFGGRKEERRRRRAQEQATHEIRHGSRVGGEVTLTGAVTVGAFAELLGVTPAQVIQTLIGMGVMAAINQEIDASVAAKVAEKFGFTVKIQEPEPELVKKPEPAAEEDDASQLQPRWPVVTVLGHVDHGKTSLLDRIRQTRVTDQEAGGITQHIGASVVEVGDKKIVFLDTPGHEAFTALRARGAQVTDIAVLVVAADDGVMPQTVEAINHARAAGVPIVVAITKVDKPEANPERVRQQLTEFNLVPEEWGGDTVMVEVSAHTGQGIQELLEMILLVAELQELKANPNRPARGTVIEAKLERGRGPVATVLVQNGTLRVGDAFVCGTTYGRVRALFDDRGRPLQEAGPSTPVEVLGASEVPEAGDRLEVVADEREAREIAERRQEERRQEELRVARGLTLEQFAQQAAGEAGERELRLVVKADVQGSLDALVPALERLSTDEAYVRVLHTGLGAISESDVMLAAASRAIVIGFNVRPDANARRAADRENVEIRTYRVIYELLDDVKKALQGLLKPEVREVVVGQAEVRATFKVPGVGTVAGCYVTDGKIARNARVRVIRDGTVIYEGRIASLKRFKDDVREVAQGYECGVGIERFNDIKEGDVLEVFQEQEVARAL